MNKLGLSSVFLFLAFNNASASTLLYEISGSLNGAFLPVTNDPIADLLSLSRNARNYVPFSLELTIDSNSLPYVHENNSLGQRVTYRNAILNANLDLNGVEFESGRQPIPQPTDTPPSTPEGDEGKIDITNRISPSGTDVLQMRINGNKALAYPQDDRSDLFNSYTVPFNQTSGGILYDNATVGIRWISFRQIAPNFLDNDLLPQIGDNIDTGNMVFDIMLDVIFHPATPGANKTSNISLFAFSNPVFNTDPATKSELKFSVGTAPAVPVPAAVWLFGSALAGFGVLTRNQRKA